MTAYQIVYPFAANPQGAARVVAGPRGGLTVASHDGNPRRVTRAAIRAAVAAHLASQVPSIVTDCGDELPCVVRPA